MAQLDTSAKVNIPHTNHASRSDAADIASSIADKFNSREYSKAERFEEACSGLMDVYLEADPSKFNEIINNLQSKVSYSDWVDFEKNYLNPSTEALSTIRNVDLLAEKLNIYISVDSVANLQKLGMSVQSGSNGGLLVSFGSNVTGTTEDGGKIDFGKLKLSLGSDTLSVELVEKNGKFYLNCLSDDGTITRFELKANNIQEEVSPSGIRPNYTPGTRYAVVSIKEIEQLSNRN